jgi:hypothetical protein
LVTPLDEDDEALDAGATFCVLVTFLTAAFELLGVRELGFWRPAVAGWVGLGRF